MDKNNYCLIMSGGIGSRFWPASRESKPKQFLDFLGMGKTLLRLTFERMMTLVPIENIIIVTSVSYKEMTKFELPELSDNQILLEPIRRNTAPCIAYAAYHIQAINPNANIIVAPADHLILDTQMFGDVIKKGLDFVSQDDALLTIGILPSRPETGYGYIQFDDDKTEGGISKVKTFTEKPNLEIAKMFVNSGEFFWNAGIFLWSIKSIINAFREYLPEIYSVFEEGKSNFGTPNEQNFINEAYTYCTNISIDFGILEHAKNVYVIGADFGWSDVGTWGTLHELCEKDSKNNAVTNKNAMIYDSRNNFISVPKDKLVVVQGLQDYIVVESDNVLLICERKEEQKIKEFVTDVKLKFNEKYN